MKHFFLVSLMVIHLKMPQGFCQVRGLLIGSEFYNQHLKYTLFTPDSEQGIKELLGDLTLLMGAYQGFGTQNQFQNAVPNDFNVALYTFLGQYLAEQLVLQCSEASSSLFSIRAEVAEAMQKLCTDPTIENWMPLHRQLLGESISEDAWPEFKEIYQHIELLEANHLDKIKALLMSIYLSPQFILY